MKKEKMKNIEVLLNHLETNTLVYDELPYDQYDDEVSSLLFRSKTQKDLFIKEVCRAFSIDKEAYFSQNHSKLEKASELMLEKYKDFLQGDNSKGGISLMLKMERSLENQYSILLEDGKLDEISRMVLSIQSNEVKRDLRGLRNAQSIV